MKLFDKRITKEILGFIIKDFSALGYIPFHLILTIFLLILDFFLFTKYALTMALTYAFLFILRASFYMKRPKKTRKYKTLLGKVDYNSRFSAHTATSFSLAIVIGLSTTVPILIYLLIFATFIGLSRIYLKQHYIINVINGAIVGVLIGLLVNLVIF